MRAHRLSPDSGSHQRPRTLLPPLLTAALLSVVAASVSAQRQFDELGNGLPAGGDKTMAVALGDVDGDGDLDIVFGNRARVGPLPPGRYTVELVVRPRPTAMARQRSRFAAGERSLPESAVAVTLAEPPADQVNAEWDRER